MATQVRCHHDPGFTIDVASRICPATLFATADEVIE
jgi:hypothetical protein